MTHPNEPPPATGPSGRPDLPEALRPAAVRLRKLRAAWSALAPACLPETAREVAELELATRQRFGAAVADASDDGPGLDATLDALLARLCAAAHETPMERTMAALPRVLAAKPKRVLALLDVIARDAFLDPDALPTKLVLVDYLLTLVCTEGDPWGRVAPKDPVTATPMLEKISRRAERECDERLSELEADFFNAANLAVDIAEGGHLQSLRARKAKLGRSYFVPGMLRAVVAYNMALQQGLQPWICETDDEEAMAFAPAASGSVFASAGMVALHDAVRRRLAGEPDRPGAAGRIVRSLPLGDLTAAERDALIDGRLAESDLECGLLLVGLLSGPIEMLAIDLQEIGVEPDRVTGAWSDELDQLVRLEVGGAIDAAEGHLELETGDLVVLRNRWLASTTGGVMTEDGVLSAGDAPVGRRVSASAALTRIASSLTRELRMRSAGLRLRAAELGMRVEDLRARLAWTPTGLRLAGAAILLVAIAALGWVLLGGSDAAR